MSTPFRDRDREQLIAMHAARFLDLPPAVARAAADYAHQRAGDGPVLRHPGRCLITEALEEAGDAVNYLTWALDDIGLLPEDRLRLQQALAYAIAMHCQISHVRDRCTRAAAA